MHRQQLLWVNKSASSGALSRSEGHEERGIRSHVQQTRRAASDASENSHSRKRGLRRFHRAAGNVEADASSSSSSLTPSPPRELPWSTVHLDASETRSFNFFISHTAHEWSGWFDYDFWTICAPRACQSVQGIVHGLISAAALHESLSENMRTEERLHLRHYSVEQWTKALNIISRSSTTAAESLVSCIVLTCLQQFHGGKKCHLLVTSGLKMLKEFDEKAASGNVQITASERQLVDDWARPTLGRIYTRACMIVDGPAALVMSATQKFYSGQQGAPRPAVTARFATLRQARNCLGDVFNWAHDSVAAADQTEAGRAHFMALLKDVCSAWESALPEKAVLEDNMTAAMYNKAVGLLKIGFIYGRLLLQTYNAPTECIIDEYQGDCRAVMDLVSRQVTHFGRTQAGICFGIDTGLIDIVDFIGHRCRDPRIRRQAHGFLRSAARVEGDRLGWVGAKVTWALIEHEEAGAAVETCHDVPEHQRRRMINGFNYHGINQIRIQMLRYPYDANDASLYEDIWVPLGQSAAFNPPPAPEMADASPGGTPLPVAIFSWGAASFLEDAARGSYSRVKMERFYFPMPRV